MATNKRTLRRKGAATPAPKKRTLKRAANTSSVDKELRAIQRLLGEEYESLAQARRALKQESKPISERTYQQRTLARRIPAPTPASKPIPAPKPAPSKPAPKPAIKPSRFSAKGSSRNEKFLHSKKIGKAAYYRLITQWWDDHPEDDPEDNPYLYHNKE